MGAETVSVNDMRKLREDYDNLAKDFNELKKQKIDLEDALI